jgi:glycine/D-amino acid oxidase-like deaminating enzyme
LAQSGVEIVVIDAGLQGATGASFGWVNASFYADEHYHRLRAASLNAYSNMRAAEPDVPINPCGALWWEEQGDDLRQMKASLQALQYPVDHVPNDALQEMEPALECRELEALQFPDESAAEAAEVAGILLRRSGAQVMRGVTVHRVRVEGDEVIGVETSVGLIDADQVLVAAGNGAPQILEGLGVRLPMLTRPGVMVFTQPIKGRLRHVLVTPDGELRQLPDGRLMASAAANHQGDDSTVITEPVDEIARRVLAWVDPLIKGERVALSEVVVGYRPVPEDGLPVIGAIRDGVHVAVMHSGVTLAAITAELIDALVMKKASTAQMAMLAPYSIDRFQT